MWNSELTSLLRIHYPIIQAPMAGGPTSPELVSAVSNAGGLGMIGAGYMNGDQIREQIKEVRQLTNHPFGINLFVPSIYTHNQEQIHKMRKILLPILQDLDVEWEAVLPRFEEDLKTFHEQINIIIEEKIPVCSFTFGLPSPEVIANLKENSIIVVGTATTVEEAILNEKAGMAAVVAQGSEAGGHRGTFHRDDTKGLIGLMSLIPQVADNIKIPIIAAGGIMDGRGIKASTCLGASGVQMGTAFLVCEESGANHLHKEAITSSTEEEIVLTHSFSGKMARGVNNRFIKKLKHYEGEVPAYPLQNELTKGIRKMAASKGTKEYMSLWSGQSPRLAKKMTVKELMNKLITEVENNRPKL